jgi:hypothetical protein
MDGRHKTNLRSISMSNQHQDPYTPSRPSMEDHKVQLASLNFCSSGNIVYLTSKIGNGEIWFKADLSEKVFDDKRAAESLIRRMKSNHSLKMLDIISIRKTGPRAHTV